MPEGCGLDRNGNPTQDAQKILEGGVLQPFGGYKVPKHPRPKSPRPELPKPPRPKPPKPLDPTPIDLSPCNRREGGVCLPVGGAKEAYTSVKRGLPYAGVTHCNGH